MLEVVGRLPNVAPVTMREKGTTCAVPPRRTARAYEA
jgi:hypothetical protein